MNGRVFDRTTGRFISADPFIDGFEQTQGWNRYSYVKNAPLSFTDPTGFKCYTTCLRQNGVPLGSAGVRTHDFSAAFDEGKNPDRPGLHDLATNPALLASNHEAVQAFITQRELNLGALRDRSQFMSEFNRADGHDIGAREHLDLPSAPSPSTVGGTCPGSCHTSGIAIPEVTPEVRAATTRFYQNLGEDFIPMFGPHRLVTGKYYFSGDDASRLGGALASAPYLGVVVRGAVTIFRTAHYAERLTKEGVHVAQAERAVSESIDAMRSNMTIGAEVRGRFFVGDVLVEYRAYPLADGTVNVGTIFPVK
jgi:hypothetical protein